MTPRAPAESMPLMDEAKQSKKDTARERKIERLSHEARRKIDEIATLFGTDMQMAKQLLLQRFGETNESLASNLQLIDEELHEQKRLDKIRTSQNQRSSIGTLRVSLFNGPMPKTAQYGRTHEQHSERDQV